MAASQQQPSLPTWKLKERKPNCGGVETDREREQWRSFEVSSRRLWANGFSEPSPTRGSLRRGSEPDETEAARSGVRDERDGESGPGELVVACMQAATQGKALPGNAGLWWARLPGAEISPDRRTRWPAGAGLPQNSSSTDGAQPPTLCCVVLSSQPASGAVVPSLACFTFKSPIRERTPVVLRRRRLQLIIQLLTVDHSARGSMKTAAKCVSACESQDYQMH